MKKFSALLAIFAAPAHAHPGHDGIDHVEMLLGFGVLTVVVVAGMVVARWVRGKQP